MYKVIYRDLLNGNKSLLKKNGFSFKSEAEQYADEMVERMAETMANTILQCEVAIKGFWASTLSYKKDDIKRFFLHVYRTNIKIKEYTENERERFKNTG